MKPLMGLLGVCLAGVSGCKQFTNLGDNYPEKEPCTGECVEMPPLGWEGPVLLWTGSPEAAEECPARAPKVVYEGHDGLSTIQQCPTCSCGPSACVLPGLVTDSGTCSSGGNPTPYPAPDGWNGPCVSSGVVNDTQFDSIQFPPPSEAPCEPQTGTVTAQTRYDWATLARACEAAKSTLDTDCPETTVCVPTSEPPPPGFSQCLFKEGEHFECPFGYTNRRVFYLNYDSSAVGCTECTCGPPEGGACLANVRAYSDASCSTIIGGSPAGLNGGGCSEPMPGFDLRAMDATWMENQPGSCTPGGGEPFGEAVKTDPGTFCCQTKTD